MMYPKRTFDGAPLPPAIEPEELASLRALVEKRYETAGPPEPAAEAEPDEMI